MEKKSKLILILPLLLLAFYLSKQSSSTSFLSSSDLESADFHNFLKLHNKQYSSLELEYRLGVYKSNLKLIHEFNSESFDFKLSANKFADLTQEEFSSKYTSPISKAINPSSRVLKVNEETVLTAAPDSWDWRDKGAVSDVIDQGHCSSSWAAAVVGAVEGARVAQGLTSLIDLSVQEVLDCANGPADHGCAGGLIDDAYLFIQQYGLTTDEIYPYIAANQTCKQNSVKQNVTVINGFFDVPARDSGLLIHQIGMTPVVSQVDVDSYVWQFYNSGVINKYCNTNVRHSILLVGYSQTASPAYYIAKNSWGQDWGESGYVRIGVYGGVGICGIQQLSSYPTF